MNGKVMNGKATSGRVTSGYIWTLALVPGLPLAILLEIEIALLLGSNPFPPQLTVAWTVITALTILSPAISVILALLDWRALGRAGREERFHWAWSFFAFAGLGIVYVAGRCTVVQSDSVARGDSVRPYAPIRVNAVLIAAVLVLIIVIAAEAAMTLLAIFTTMTPMEAGES